METTPQTVRETLVKLRELPPIPVERRVAALAKLWQQVCLAPPEPTPAPFVPHFADPPLVQGRVDTSGASSRVGSGGFPWAQVRRGIKALARSAPHCSESGDFEKPGVLALILAGNTPLLAWPVLHYAVLLGIPVFIKQSRDETVWTRHFVETLAEIDPEVAALLHLDSFPGDDLRTKTLVQNADAVIAYGGDESIAALHEATPEATPFQGFGHAISIGLIGGHWDAHRFARDVLMYDQAGCLSLQTLLVAYAYGSKVGHALALALERQRERLGVKARTDAAECRIVREARDLALMEGREVLGNSDLCWSVVIHQEPCPLPAPTGFCVVHVIPYDDQKPFQWFLGEYVGKISCVGECVPGRSDWWNQALKAEGVSRICQAGTMQMPPLDWRNGNVDLRVWLLEALGDVRSA
ncbi:acyl-CoA reductase [Armatimonas sp.]|uniref:acyl-CoA reductase n=1 Tax=Armatimonas sp. TaxID=1872638 RepID=UPI003751B010